MFPFHFVLMLLSGIFNANAFNVKMNNIQNMKITTTKENNKKSFVKWPFI